MKRFVKHNMGWMSNAPHAATGYGNQTELFTIRLQKAGHDVTIFAFYGLHGAILNFGGIPILPGTKDAYGNDMLVRHQEYYQFDWWLALMDIFVLNAEVLRDTGNVFVWAPVDHDRFTPSQVHRAQHTRGLIAMSLDGKAKMEAAGFKPYYIPHGVDSKVFQPVESNWRQMYGLEDKFVVGMVLANKGAPSRKAFDPQIRAFAKFQKSHPDAVLYLHTDMQMGYQGENIDRILELAEVPPSAVRTVTQYQYINGMIPSHLLSKVYSSCDVVMNATRGEGFGIPIVEAQMCGAPVITTNFSAMPEITKSGWSVDYVDYLYTAQEAYQVLPSPDAMVDALEEAYKLKGDQEYRREVRAKILDYDADRVYENYFIPVMDAIAEEMGMKPETDPLPVEIKRSDYMPNGLIIEGAEYFPARKATADYALCKRSGKPDEVVRGWGMDVAGMALDIDDDPNGGVAKLACWEAEHQYGLHEMNLKPGDVVFDVGAQVGVVSIYLAKRYPGIKVYAFEPMPQNFSRLQRNIKANGVAENVTAINKAMTGDGRKVTIAGDTTRNSGGASIFKSGKSSYEVNSITLQDAVHEYGSGIIALLKLDCEGAEYEIIDSILNQEWKPIIKRIRGEVHPRIYGHEGDLREAVARATDDYRMVVYDGGMYASEPKPVQPDVSVIIPSLNGHSTIQTAIDAALNQTGVNMEVVICDDGSTPPLADVITPDDRVKVIRHDSNMGQVAAMNTATAAATGRYFIFHGDDDHLERESMRLIVDEFDKQPETVGFVYGAQRYHGLRTDTVIPQAFDADLLKRTYYPLNGVLYRRSLYESGIHWRKTGEYNALEDWDYALQVVNAGHTGYGTRILILHYTLSGERGWAKYRANEKAVWAAFREIWPLESEKVSA